MITRTVTIPARIEHDGYHALTVTLPWVCLVCGAPRGEPYDTISYDGSRRLHVQGWINPCGHIEKYADVRAALVQPGETYEDSIEREVGRSHAMMAYDRVGDA